MCTICHGDAFDLHWGIRVVGEDYIGNPKAMSRCPPHSRGPAYALFTHTYSHFHCCLWDLVRFWQGVNPESPEGEGVAAFEAL